MLRSDSVVHLVGALLQAQRIIKNPTKDALNPHFKSRYASLVSVLEEIRPVLIANGLVVTQTFEIGNSVILETTLWHESGEFIAGRMAVVPAKADPQGVMSAVTYAARYSLLRLFNLATEEDDDGNAASSQTIASGSAQFVPTRIPGPIKPGGGLR